MPRTREDHPTVVLLSHEGYRWLAFVCELGVARIYKHSPMATNNEALRVESAHNVPTPRRTVASLQLNVSSTRSRHTAHITKGLQVVQACRGGRRSRGQSSATYMIIDEV